MRSSLRESGNGSGEDGHRKGGHGGDRRGDSTDAPILVVGAGPAGSACALLLARAGRSVTIVDRAEFPRRKACGECANPGTVAEIEALGLGDIAQGLRPGVLRGWELQTPSGATVRTAFPAGLRTRTFDRARLDAALLDAAVAAGADFESRTTFEGVEGPQPSGGPAQGPLQVRLRHGDGRRETRAAALLVGADGLHSQVRREVERAVDGVDDRPCARGSRIRKVGLSVHLEGVPLDPAWGRLVLDPGGTVGLSALDREGRRWTLVHVTRPVGDAAALPSRPEELVARVARSVPEVIGGRVVSPVLGSGPYDQPVERIHANGILLIGDAAGYFDPVTGQGIGRSLRSARLASDAILAGGGRAELDEYGIRLRAARRDGIRIQRIIEAAVRRPALLERLVPAMARTGLLDRLIAVTGDIAPASELWAPSSWPRWALTLLHASLASSPRN